MWLMMCQWDLRERRIPGDLYLWLAVFYVLRVLRWESAVEAGRPTLLAFLPGLLLGSLWWICRQNETCAIGMGDVLAVLACGFSLDLVYVIRLLWNGLFLTVPASFFLLLRKKSGDERREAMSLPFLPFLTIAAGAEALRMLIGQG